MKTDRAGKELPFTNFGADALMLPYSARRANHPRCWSILSCENIPLPIYPKSTLQLPPSCPAQRGVGRRHDEGQVAVDAAASARAQLQGGFPVSDQAACRRTTPWS